DGNVPLFSVSGTSDAPPAEHPPLFMIASVTVQLERASALGPLPQFVTVTVIVSDAVSPLVHSLDTVTHGLNVSQSSSDFRSGTPTSVQTALWHPLTVA